MAGLDPLVDGRTEALILGTFPGPESLGRKKYYADPRNQFWSIMERIVPSLGDLDYSARGEALLRRKIGLWDVIFSCVRDGAADRAISEAVPNDIAGFLRDHPQVRVLFFNGEAAWKCFRQFHGTGPVQGALGLAFEVLPSSSGANTHLTVSQKSERWMACLRKHGL